ncbi:hypothetical protein [uncultured Streptomyces sp.]|uniref:hypothetical protein n=1 Tax=uncultured Streptomyces sp. TaxID=174707 RepID=UPI002610AFE7|nr:hypothetical protein [uncultured Streptomyces sp.]
MTQVVTLSAPGAHDGVALAEIELCGELMIAASASGDERLSVDRIDEVLDVRVHRPHAGQAPAVPTRSGRRTTIPRQADPRG